METGETDLGVSRRSLVFAFALRQATRAVKDSDLARRLTGQLAEVVTTQRVRDWKEGNEVPGKADIAVIAEELGVPVEALTKLPRHHLSVVFALNLYKLQRDRGWNQGALGAAIGLEKPGVSRLLSGAHQPTRDQVERYAAALSVPPGFFFLHPDDEGLEDPKGSTGVATPEASACEDTTEQPPTTYDPSGPQEPEEWRRLWSERSAELERLRANGFEWAIVAAHNYRLPSMPAGFEKPRLRASFYYALILALVTGTTSENPGP